MASESDDEASKLLGTSTVCTKKQAFLTFEEALSQAGGFGRFQIFALTALILCHISGGMMVYGLGFLLK
jgi:hypothetical protein